MEKYSPRLFFIAISCMVLISCAKNPTEPSHYEQLKREYIGLAGTLQHELESFRGKTFKRPVTTAVYTLEQYKSIVTQFGSTLTPAEKKIYNDIFKAEGLLHQNADYFAGRDSMIANETGGFYKGGSDSIFIIFEEDAQKLTRWDSTALFHELVHALQDQHIGLKSLDSSVRSSDQSYGVQYVLEGEAELFSIYYHYKYNGEYPLSYDVMWIFDTMAVLVNKDLDSMHNIGKLLLNEQPFSWAYFSYGPKFINSVVGQNWALIDANIYPRLPVKTCVVMHPNIFPTEYQLQFNAVASFIDSTQIMYEVDELGEVLMNVLFREWNFNTYLQLAQGLRADNIVAYRNQTSDSVRIGWYTYWQDNTKSADFFTNIAVLISAKRNITLPAAMRLSDTSIVNDTLNKVYIEQQADHVFVLEDYETSQLSELIARMRGVKWYINSPLAKSTVQPRRYPFIDKSKLVKEWRRNPVSNGGGVR